MKTYLLCTQVSGQPLTCINAIEWDETQVYVPEAGQFLIAKQGDEWIGWTFVDGAWVAPPEPPPQQADDGAQQ